jgi:hypothetical protein
MVSIANLFHLATKTNNLDHTVRFLRKSARSAFRHPPGYWLPWTWLAAPGGFSDYSVKTARIVWTPLGS